MSRLLLLVLFLPLFSAFADPVAPTCTPDSEDSSLFQGQSARDFFNARAADATCAQRYQQAKSAYDDARAQLKQLVTSGASASDIDAQESQVDTARTPFLEAMADCGPCAAQPIGDPIEITGGDRTQVWYQVNGSCQLPISDRAQLSQAYERLSDALTRISQYPRQANTGTGFHPILALYAVDSAGRRLPDVDKLPSDRATRAFLAIQGPLVTAFTSLLDVTYQTFERNGLRQLTVHEEEAPSDGFRPPRTISYLTASGKRKVAIGTFLPRTNGQWYLNDDGYLRYCLSADFGLRSQFVESFGRSILLDLLSGAVEKATP